MNSLKRLAGAAAIGLAALLAVSCGNSLLSKPLASCALAADPSATPGSATSSIEFHTTLDSRCQVEYGTVAGTFSSASIIEASLARDHAYALSGLSPSTAYYYRVRMIDSSGAETRSGQYGFTTAADAGAPAILTGPTASPGETTCAIAFATSVDARAVVEYGASPGAYANATVIEPSAGPSHAITISGLTPSRTYYYQVRMYNSTGDIMSLSPESSFSTTADTGFAALSATPAVTVAETSCTVAFSTTVNAKCIVEYGTAPGSYASATVVEPALAGPHSIPVSGLYASTTYYFRVRMFSATQVTTSAEYNFTTSSGAQVLTNSPTPSVASCSVSYATDIAARCYIEYGTTLGTYPSVTPEEGSAGTGHTTSIAGLSPSTPYYYRVRMTSVAGTRTTSAANSFTTAADPDYPALTGGLTRTPTETGCSISFSTTIPASCVIQYGTVSGTYTGMTAADASGTAHTIAISALSASTLYYYTIRMIGATHETTSVEDSFTTTAGAAILGSITTTPAGMTCAISFYTNSDAICYIEYGTASGSYATSFALESAADVSHSGTIAGLSPQTPYYYRVRMVSPAGTVTYSTERTFTTSAYVVGLSPSSTVSTTTGLASLTIAWTSAFPYAATITYGTAANTYTALATEGSATTSHSIILTGLPTGTAYYYRIRESVNYSSGEYSATTATPTVPTLAQRLRGIWIIGGMTGASYSTATTQVDFYDPVSNTYFYNYAPMNIPVSFMGAASIEVTQTDHRIYVFGGFNASGAAVNSIQMYSIESGGWTTMPSVLPLARAGITASTLKGRIYVIGGTAANALAATAYAPANTVYYYVPNSTPSADSINTFGATLATVSLDRSTAAYGDAVYYFGGRMNTGGTYYQTPSASNYGVAVSSNATNLAMSALAREGLASALWSPSGGTPRILAAGGYSALTFTASAGANFIGNAATTTPAATCNYINYPFSTVAWQTMSALPTVISEGAAAIGNDGINDQFIYFGGLPTASSFVPTNTIYSLQLDTTFNANAWSPVTPTMSPLGSTVPARWGHAAVSIQNE